MKRIPSTAMALLLAACGPIGSRTPPEEQPEDTGDIPAEDTATPTDTAVADNGTIDSGPPTPKPIAPDGYYVSGNKIYDSKNAPHVFHGIARPSTEWNWKGEHLQQSDIQLIASWKANVVRFTLNQGFWLPGSSVYASGYEATIDQGVQWARTAGMDVILDLHWSDRGNAGTTPAQQRMADARSLEMWKLVAAKYKGDGHVLFELYNEPHDVDWDVWQNGGDTGEGWTSVGMQQLYDAVRSVGANNVVIIGGLRYAFDLSGVTTHRISGYNIVYATHPYNTGDKQPPTWDNAFGNLTATDPVMVTEFGDISGACGDSYSAQLIAYADTHGASWSAWAWYVSDCRFPSLISDWSGTPTAVGATVKAALAKY